VAAALSIFCAGSKSDKLQLAWALYDSDGDGALTAAQLARLISAFLLALLHMTDQAASMAPAQLHALLDRAAAYVADSVLAASSSASGRISFEGFSTFYNTQSGFTTAPYLELLDLRVRALRKLTVQCSPLTGHLATPRWAAPSLLEC
jgi:hypothetical protein